MDPSLPVLMFAPVYVHTYRCVSSYYVTICICACVSTILCFGAHVYTYVCLWKDFSVCGSTCVSPSGTLAPQLEAEVPKKSCLGLGLGLPHNYCSSMPLSLFCLSFPSSWITALSKVGGSMEQGYAEGGACRALAVASTVLEPRHACSAPPPPAGSSRLWVRGIGQAHSDGRKQYNQACCLQATHLGTLPWQSHTTYFSLKKKILQCLYVTSYVKKQVISKPHHYRTAVATRP